MQTTLLELLRIACDIHGEDESSILTNATVEQMITEFDTEDPEVVQDSPLCFWGTHCVFSLDYTPERGNYLIHIPRHPYDAKGKLFGRLPRD
jgi:hypothetical protein